jgi:hypothetical protein
MKMVILKYNKLIYIIWTLINGTFFLKKKNFLLLKLMIITTKVLVKLNNFLE